MSTFVLCVGCGEPLYGHPCQRCTCERCGNDLRDGYCFLCNSRNGNSFIYDSSPNSFDNPPDFSYPPPQPQTYSCEFCGNDAHYCYDCPPQVPFIYNPEPCYNQDFNFPQNFQSYPQQYPCCENCGGPHETFQCQPLNQNCYDYNSPSFDQFQPPQYPVIHQPIREKTCAELLAEEQTANINTQSTQYSVVHQPPQETSLEFLQDNRNLINSVQTFLGKFKRFSFYETPKVVSLAWETISKIEHAFEDKQYQPEGILELFRKLYDDVQNIHEELAEYINTPSWNRPTIYCDDDDDDEDYTIAITPDLPITDSLIMEDEHLDTIPATESDELIKSSVPIPSESEDFSDIESECDVPDCDDSQTTNFLTFSNPLFDDSTSSDDESSHEEVIHEISFKTYSNPLSDLNEETISSEFYPIHNEDLDSTSKNDRFNTESYLR
ncbi:hypothetical protein Tco_1413983 [Tanacetum coccineum]